MMLEVPSPLPLGIAASVVISRPPPKPASTSRSGTIAADQTGADWCPGVNPEITKAAFTSEKAPTAELKSNSSSQLWMSRWVAQIDRADADHRLGCYSPVDLDRRLPVQQHRGVEDRPAVLQRVRRSVAPTAGQVQSGWGPPPGDLVAAQGAAQDRLVAAAASNLPPQVVEGQRLARHVHAPRRTSSASPSP